MSSGTYFPPPVRAVEIPKKEAKGCACSGCPPWPTGSPRRWCACIWSRRWSQCSIPTPTAIGLGGRRWTRWGSAGSGAGEVDWVIDLDLRAFFDSIDHDLMLKAVSKHTDLRWVLLYVERWLKAPLQTGGRHPRRTRSGNPAGLGDLTPAGQPVPPLRVRSVAGPGVPGRSASSATRTTQWCTARTEAQARLVLAAITERMAQVGLELHPDKTRIVYCKDADRRGSHEHERFNFLGYTFRPRLSKSKHGHHFVNFSPAVSDDAKKAIGRGDPLLADQPAQRQDPHRPCTHVQPHRARVDQLLRALLQVHVVSASPTHQRLPRSLGHAEIQAAPPARQPGTEVAADRRTHGHEASSPTGGSGWCRDGWTMGAG